MKVPLSWLKEYIDTPLSPEDIANTLTLAGLEVDAIDSITPSFQGVVVAHILSVEPHPNADRLRVAKVSDGTEEFQVVCGAPNCRKGLITAFAKIGASLKDDQGKAWTIKKGKLRDVESFGMLCSGKELGLGLEDEGILELSPTLKIGTDFSTFYSDVVFDISLTPNLGHCMSLYGIARELSALLHLPLKKLQVQLPDDHTLSFPKEIHIKDTKNCDRYSSRLVQSVQIGPSPEWLVKKLELSGLKSINNVVDISNYVMMETGQPLHFFDYDILQGNSLFIDSCTQETRVKLIGDEEKTLPSGTLVIRDEKEIVAVAGVIGCAHSGISEKTKNVLIEAALFQPASIRKTSKALSLKTDASNRFEKGIDPLMLSVALDQAASLLEKVAQGSVFHRKADSNIHPFIAKKITCRLSKINSLLGLHLSLREIVEIFERLQIKVLKEHADSLETLIPSHRNDLKEEVDLIEEVARIYGFHHIPKTPNLHYSSPLPDTPLFTFENRIRALMLQEGLQEWITCDLISPSLIELTEEKRDLHIEPISILQSKSSDYSVLRPSLLPGFLQVSKHNFDRQNQNIAGFEIGRIHFKQKEQYLEQTSLSILLSGQSTPHHYAPKTRPFDFFDLKGIVENLLNALKISEFSFKPSFLQNFQPGRQAFIQKGDLCLGVIGEIHPSTLSKLDLPQRVYFAEINLEELLHLTTGKKITIADLPLYPSSERDLTLSLKKETPIHQVMTCIEDLAPPLLEQVFLLDLFESEKIGLDRKNVTWRFIYRDLSKTLDLKTVEQEHTKLIQKVAEKLQSCIL